jgi:hypothetical protein
MMAAIRLNVVVAAFTLRLAFDIRSQRDRYDNSLQVFAMPNIHLFARAPKSCSLAEQTANMDGALVSRKPPIFDYRCSVINGVPKGRLVRPG